MKRQPGAREWLPLSRPGKPAMAEPTGEAFRPEWIDFQRGIRVGNLEPHERITQILKFNLEKRHATPFVTDRWGRGVYWQWICWLPRANRRAKPLSHAVNFGCAKLFIAVDRPAGVFQAGLQVERGRLPEAAAAIAATETAGAGSATTASATATGAVTATAGGNFLQEDWDWHRLLRQCREGSPLDQELRRLLLREGFVVEVGDWEHNLVLRASDYRSAAQLRGAARGIAPDCWGGFQLYYPMPAREVRASTGYELVRAVLAVFAEVVPAMNLCMQVPLAAGDSAAGDPRGFPASLGFPPPRSP